jgi:serine/threonine-protein kinase RsbW
MESLIMPGRLENLDEIRAFVKSAANRAGLAKQAVYRLVLAVDEIATNAVVYGFGGADMTGELRIHADTDDQCLRVILEDNGPPYDPRQAPVPEDMALPPDQRKIGGLGVFLSLKNVDSLDYERKEGWNRNIFVMKLAKNAVQPRTE